MFALSPLFIALFSWGSQRWTLHIGRVWVVIAVSMMGVGCLIAMVLMVCRYVKVTNSLHSTFRSSALPRSFCSLSGPPQKAQTDSRVFCACPVHFLSLQGLVCGCGP